MYRQGCIKGCSRHSGQSAPPALRPLHFIGGCASSSSMNLMQQLQSLLAALGSASTARSTAANLQQRRNYVGRCVCYFPLRHYLCSKRRRCFLPPLLQPRAAAATATCHLCSQARARQAVCTWQLVKSSAPSACRRKFAVPVQLREVERDWAAQGFHCGCIIDPPGALLGRACCCSWRAVGKPGA